MDGGHREMIDRAVTDRLGFTGSAVRSASLAALPRSRTKRCRRGRTGRYRNALWCRPGRSCAVSGSQILCRSRVCSACRIIPFSPTPRPKMGMGSSERRVSRSRLSAGHRLVITHMHHCDVVSVKPPPSREMVEQHYGRICRREQRPGDGVFRQQTG